MTQQPASEIVRLYIETVQWTDSIIRRVRPSQLGAPTPCAEWNVQALLNHMAGGTVMYAATLSGTEASRPTEDAKLEDFLAGSNTVVDLVSVPGATEKMVTTRRGEVKAGEYLENAFMDALTHGWDLAIATGQDATMPPHLAQACYDRWALKAEGMRGRAFGSEVQVPEGASIQVKLLGVLGRQG
jgi:uncharacterized protein (TIGR03086 family)